MYSLYEGSVKAGFESETVFELLDKLPDTEGEGEFGSQVFHGRAYAYDREGWEDWIRFLLDDEDGFALDLEDWETVESRLAGWLKDRGLPRELGDGQVVVCVDRDSDLEERWRVFDGDPDLATINEMLSWCAPDYGYRIVYE